MAVETRFVVIRDGVEVKTFMDKKSADEHDKMLDMAEAISGLLKDSPVTLSENDYEELSIYLASNRDPLLIALQAKKAKVSKPPKVKDSNDESPVINEAEPEPLSKAS